jgi:hypothetical protein
MARRTLASSQYRPGQETIERIRVVDSNEGWIEIRDLIGELRGATTTCALIDAATANPMSEPAPSLGLIKPTVTRVRRI